MAKNSDVLLSVGLDQRPLNRGLTQAHRSVQQRTRQMSRSLAGVGSQVSGLGSALASLGPQAGPSLGAVGTAISGVGSLLTGGLVAAVGIGIGALVTGLVSAARKGKEAREHMEVLARATGMSAQDVQRLRQAFDAAGMSLSQLEAQRIAAIAAEAGVSADQVDRLTGKIKDLATLRGIDTSAAAREVFSAHTQAAKDTEKLLESLNAQLDEQESGASSAMVQLAQRSDQLMAKRAEKEKELAAATAARDAALARYEGQRAKVAEAEESGIASLLAAREREAQMTLDSISQREAQADAAKREIASIDGLLKRLGATGARLHKDALDAASERAKAEAEIAAKEAIARARAREAAAMETELLAATAARDDEAAAVARLTQALAQLEARRKEGTISTADAATQAKLMVVQHEDAVEAIRRQMVDRQTDAILRLRAAEAGLTGDLIAQAHARGDAAIEQLQRRLRTEEELVAAAASSMATADGAELERLQRLHDERVAMADATRKEIVLTERATSQEIARIRAELAMQSRDYDRQTAVMAASLADDRLEVIRLRAEAELEEVQRLEAAKTITHEQAEARRSQIRAQAQAEQSQVTQAQIQEAMYAGAAIGQNFVQGIKGATEGDEWQSIFKSFLLVVAGIASVVPGGQLAGLGLNLFSGFFAHGGLIRGPGGPREDRVIVGASPGEFISQAESVKRFGVPFYAQLNRGILDLSSLPSTVMPRFAHGGLVGAAPQLPAPVIKTEGSSVQNVTIHAPGGFLHRELLLRELPGLLRQVGIQQQGTFVRSMPSTRSLRRRG